MARTTVPCPGCGASVPPTGACKFCGSTAFLEGVAGKLLPSTLHCPRCKGGPSLSGLEHQGIRADLCMTCHGVWFGPGLLDEAIRTASKRPPLPGEAAAGPIHGGMETVRYALCPVCKGGMSRTPYAQRPLVIIDRCPFHGDWCDAGELGQLQVIARTRGMAALHPRPAAEEKPKLSEKEIKDAMKGFQATGGGIFTSEVLFQSHGRRRGRRGGPDLFDMLWSLFAS